MRDTTLLQLALGLTPPWTVSRSDFDPEAHRLDIEIDFAPGSSPLGETLASIAP